MVRLTLLTLACLTLLIACTDKETQSAPKPAPAPEAPVLEQSEIEFEEMDETDSQPDYSDEDSDLSLDEEDILPDSEDMDVPEEIEEATDSAGAGYQRDGSGDSNQTAGNDAGAGTQYTVRAGDTLGRIAISHNVTVDSIVRANNLSDKNTIRVGQQLIVE